ncbi:MAG: superoxide dismutase family protein [Zoogloeaceae bacterium]|nr:superoxide dismutase family protein [Zoogloeaceae bacterium]
MKKLLGMAALAAGGMMFAAGAVAADAQKLSAKLNPTQGNTASGVIEFFAAGDNKVRVVGEVMGLTPGAHGFHIHEKGDCSAPDGTSTGGHFNPHQVAHGKFDAAAHHTGDLPSLMADDKGEAKIDVVVDDIALIGPDGIEGRGLIVHAQPDDYMTQPTGNAGGRVACGVIGK